MNQNLLSLIKSTITRLFVIACLISQVFMIAPASAEQLTMRASATALSPSIGGCPMFPSNNIWNTPIDKLPVHARSDQWVNTIGRYTGFHMDFGSGTWDGGPIGIPHNVVGSNVPKVSVSFYYADQSDPGPYPIPNNPLIEYGSDHHILIVDNSNCTLYEIYDASYYGGSWHAGSGAIWSLNSNALRPDTWTSADAAGLPILPGLVRYDEIVSGEINHAIRFTAENTNGYIWPARHLTSDDLDAPQIPPMGARFRLKAAYNISGYPPAMQVILKAMKTYGIILADNGSDWYVSGSPDERWDNDMLHLLDDLTGDDFEAVDASGLMVDYDSGATGFVISGNVGAPGVALNYMDGSAKSVTSQYDGSYSIQIGAGWSGMVTPSSPCYTFDPPNRSYSSLATNKAGENYTAISPSSANVHVQIAGLETGNYLLPHQDGTRRNYDGIDGGPMKVTSANCVPIVASLRDLWWNGSAYTSSIQLMGLPQNLLSDTYVFPSYNNVSLSDQIRFGNVGNANTTVTVTIGGIVRGTYPLASNQREKVSYPGLDSGPVIIKSSNGVPIIASIRDAWINNGVTSSFSQLMGLPQNLLSDTYYFPSYNNLSLSDQIRFGNVGNAPTTVTITIGGVVRGTYPLQPNERQKVDYPSLDSGPVIVHSSNSVPIIASLREAWIDNGITTSYFQMMGLPQSQLSDKYAFPAYDNVSLSGQLRFGNVGNTSTTVTVTISGVVQGAYDLAPNQRQKVSYAGLDDGPVVIQSSNGVPIIASLRDAWLVNGVTTSFSQLMGLPGSQLSNVYVFPSYNNVTYDNQLRIGVP